jgi:hypothetical protein
VIAICSQCVRADRYDRADHEDQERQTDTERRTARLTKPDLARVFHARRTPVGSSIYRASLEPSTHAGLPGLCAGRSPANHPGTLIGTFRADHRFEQPRGYGTYALPDPANWDTPPRDSGIHVLGWVELLNGWARPSIGVVGRADPGESRPWNRGRSHRMIAKLVTRS